MNNEVYHYLSIAGKISRNRFLEFYHYNNFVGNSTLSPPESPDYDRLGKIRLVAEFFSSLVAAVYKIGRDTRA